MEGRQKVLISGITGFVGSNLKKHFQQQDYKIMGLSRRNELNEQNCLSWDQLEKISSYDVDAILHLAGKAHDLKNTSVEAEYFTVNTDLTISLFKHFLQSPAKTFIYFSSVKAAADKVENILFEDVIPDPQTAYGQSKLKAEEYLLSQSLPEGKRCIILRPCMIHGPNNKGNLNLLYQFVNKGIPYPLAAFENRRSFLSIDNLCFILQKLIEDSTIPSGIYNVADDESLSTNEVVKIISEALNKKERLWRISPSFLKSVAKIGDVVKLPLNTERLKKLTENYIVSNQKIKRALKINQLPVATVDGLKLTIQSFSTSNS